MLVTRLPGSTATAIGGFLDDAVISADGAYVAFDSVGEGLEAGVDDSNQKSDVFLYDRAAGTNATVSLRDPGLPSVTANGYTTWAWMGHELSADGRFVAFDSTATNLLPMQTHSDANVFLADRELGTVTLVSRSTSFPAEGANRSSERPSLSEDGRFVAFESFANDLVGGQVDGTQTKDVFLFDRSAASMTLVSHAAGAPGTASGWYSQEAAASGDGRYVAYWSQATTLVPGQVDTNNGYDLFLFDRISGATALVSHAAGSPATAGYPAKFFSSPPRPRISRDGRYVAYTSPADDLIGGMNSSGYDNLYLFDRVTGVNTLASRSAASPTVGGNDHTHQAALDSEGRFVAFASEATNLVAGQDDGNGSPDIFLYDRASGATVLVSRSANGVSRTGQGYSWEPEISADGRYVAYASRAPDLVPGGLDTNGQFDVFLFDRTTGVTGLASHKVDQPTVAGDGESRRPFINADGGYLSFSSTATDLAANGSPSAGYLYDRRAGAAKGIGGSGPISFDGRHVAFLSGAVDLVPGDYNSASDLFVFSDLPPAQDFYTLPPCRLFDSRESGAGGPLVSGVKALLRAHGLCGLPATAAALSVNVTVTQSTGPGHLTLFAGDAPEPGTSTINFGAGQTRANNAILSLATDGMGTLAVLPHVLGGGSVHVVLDVNGWFE
ncbi:MAG TPA: hypothetical protein VNJ70_19240 [Thermoanaerobaculia bacterium]|nr:hypothetical protein [Thermoanaerobaculia bacterium]